jgi:prolyl oligopeptidase
MPVDTGILESVSEVLHGKTVVDPYRWLEDRTLPQTESWIHDQQRKYDKYFAMCPGLELIRDRVRNYLDVAIVDQPTRVADRYFYRRRNRHQEQACIYVRDIATNVERLLVDPSDQGPFASVSIHRISSTGSLVAYEVRHGGEDKHAICIVDVESGETLLDRLDVGYARGFAFTAGADGFYYCRDTQECTENHTIRLHVFRGSEVDKVVFSVPRTEESRLILTADNVNLGAIWLHRKHSETLADFFIADHGDDSRWKTVFSDNAPDHNLFLHQGRIFRLKSAKGEGHSVTELACDGRDMRIIVSRNDTSVQQIVIAEDIIYVSYLDMGIPRVEKWTLNGEHIGDIDTPKDGAIRLLANRSPNGTSLFYSYESFDKPLTIFEYVSLEPDAHVWYQRHSVSETVQSKICQVSFQSNDGTEIPLTLVSYGETFSNRPTAVLLTGYGGFGAILAPQFSVLGTIMKELGATLAIAHVRGGGEFGQAWHDAGRRRNRQNAIDDFIAGAEWLREHGVVTPDKLATFGGSNAGLLVAAAMTQRPKLFGAVLCIAPLLDMLRYQYFDQAVKWRDEFGTAANADDFRALYAYSPYHHVESDVDYPPVMFVGGDKDDRCNPAHVRKMAALLQCRTAQRSAVIVDYSEQRGHALALPLSTRVEALARRIAFLCKELNVSWPAGGDHEAICH